ncbi:MAG: YfhO family protein, partial [Gemmatimonadota bacterium]|nr:YfhO family protein [Gemmatimonadota bacterium]
FQGDYPGVVVLMLAGLGIGGFRRDRHSRELWFWAVTVVAALLWALGGHTPFYNIPFYLIPGTRYFRAPDSVFFVGTLGVAIFAARGAERALAGEATRKYVMGWGIFAAVVALLAATGMLTAIARGMAPEQRLDAVDANNANLVAGAIRCLVFVVLAGLVMLKASSIRRSAGRFAPLAAIALLSALDLFVVNKQYWVFSPPASQLYASDAAIDYLRRLPQPGRVLPLAAQDGGSQALYFGSELMAHGILDVEGYHGNEIARYNTLIGIEQGSGPSNQSMRQILMNSNVRRLTATQYILTNGHELAGILPGVTQVAGPAREDATGNTNYVFRLPGDAPFAWVAPVIVKAGDEAVLATVMNSRFDIQTAALFDSAAAVKAGPTVTTLPQPTGIVAHVDRYAPGSMAFTLGAPAPAGSALIVSENYYPGWQATVDGKPAAIGRAQYSLIGVELPAGARRIQLAFTSAPYETGKLITWLAIVIAIVTLAVGSFMERRRVA